MGGYRCARGRRQGTKEDDSGERILYDDRVHGLIPTVRAVLLRAAGGRAAHAACYTLARIGRAGRRLPARPR
jgi:hypothetical protein